jgi:hypothetical protein
VLIDSARLVPHVTHSVDLRRVLLLVVVPRRPPRHPVTGAGRRVRRVVAKVMAVLGARGKLRMLLTAAEDSVGLCGDRRGGVVRGHHGAGGAVAESLFVRGKGDLL